MIYGAEDIQCTYYTYYTHYTWCSYGHFNFKKVELMNITFWISNEPNTMEWNETEAAIAVAVAIAVEMMHRY